MKIKGLLVALTLVSSMMTVTPAFALGETLDQVSNSPGYANAGVSTQTERYQSFTAGLSGPLARIDLSLSRATSETTEPISVKLISTDVSGEPNSTDVLAQTSIPANRVGKSKSWVRAIFPTPYSLDAGTKYALLVTTSQNPDPNANGEQAGFNWFGNDWNEPDYADGSSSTRVISMDRWYRNGYDLAFRTYSGAYTQPTTTVTYDLDGGTSVLPTEENQAEGDTFPVADNPTKPGFVFNGWTNQGGDLYGGFDYVRSVYTMGQSNVVLKANWLPLAHPISRLVHNNGNGGDWHWFWNGGGLHEGTDVQPGWCVINGPGSDPKTWIVTGRQNDAQSESFSINSPNQFQTAPYTFSPDPDISITTGASQTVMPNQAITATAITNTGCEANKYSIEPALPAGLTLNESTGVISGSPIANQAKTIYTVTAKRFLNEDNVEQLDVEGMLQGQDTATFELTVGKQASTISFPKMSLYFKPNVTTPSQFDLLQLKTVLAKYSRGATVKIVAYVYGTSQKSSAYSRNLAKALAQEIKRIRPTLRTQISLANCNSAPRAARGSVWTTRSFRVDLVK